MKAVFYIFVAIALLQCMPQALHAQETRIEDTQTKIIYQNAKHEIEDMLNGKTPLSYERCIYLLENAWHDDRIAYKNFQNIISYGIGNISTIVDDNSYQPDKANLKSFSDALQKKRREDKGYLSKAKANYAIYRYMTDSTYYVDTNSRIITSHWPYKYATNDPLGTTDWTNTQVGNLLLNGKGNCFAFVSLFKIYSERLQSEANICTAPGHVYISHKDENGTKYNVEIASKTFPGTGTLSTLTHTTNTAIENDISLRELNLKQSVALCLVYLAKGYEHKVNLCADDGFMMSCATAALKYDSLNLNALLLKAEILENNILANNKSVSQLQANTSFKEYNKLIAHLFTLGYREMPLDMKNILIKGWTKDTITHLATKNYLPKQKNTIGSAPTRYASLSWGLFEEQIGTKPIERYGRTLFNTKQQKITGFSKEQVLYNNYNFDPVLFALNVDPLAKEFPSWSPYAAMGDNPIRNIDPDGRKFYNFNSSGDYVGTSHNNFFHNLFFKQGRVLDNSGGVTRQFRFADRKNDPKNIENGTITKLVIVTDQDMKTMVARSGGFDHDNKTENRSLGERYGHIRAEGIGGGRMDFSVTQIPRMYPGVASNTPLDEASDHALFLPPSPKATGEYAHNQMNFGNFMFGLSGQSQGFSLGELQYGAEYNSLFNSTTNGYEGQFDSRDDQFSIGKGYEYGASYGYDKKEFKVVPGAATPSLVEPTGR